jgi:hypothetical protein
MRTGYTTEEERMLHKPFTYRSIRSLFNMKTFELPLLIPTGQKAFGRCRDPHSVSNSQNGVTNTFSDAKVEDGSNGRGANKSRLGEFGPTKEIDEQGEHRGIKHYWI